MSENEQSLNQVLNELLKIFPSPELEALVRQLADPLKCKNSKEMMIAIQKNMELIKSKEEEILGLGKNSDKSSAMGYVENPSNFSVIQHNAIEKTKEVINSYERELELALEMGDIELVDFDPEELKAKRKAKSRRKKLKRIKNPNKWMKM